MALSRDDVHDLPHDERTLYRRAVDFHGHWGPYLLFGVRAGLRARTLLPWTSHFAPRVEAWVGTSPSPSCMADGLQISTGATLGKGSIVLHPIDDDGVRAQIRVDRQQVLIRLRDEALEAIRSVTSMAEAHDRANDLTSWSDEELFITEGPTTITDEGAGEA